MRLKRIILIGVVLVTALIICIYNYRSDHPVPAPPLRELSQDNLLLKDGRWFEKGFTNPFQGVMLETYPDHRLKSRSTISNGFLSGISEGWYTNGTMQVRE